MNAGNFEQTSVTIPKGSKLMLVADQNSFHIIANGTWQNCQGQRTFDPFRQLEMDPPTW